MAKKDFKTNAAEFFISSADEQQVNPDTDSTALPEGYRILKPVKNQRMQLLVRSATKEGIKRAADAQGISMNELINNIIDEYLKGLNA